MSIFSNRVLVAIICILAGILIITGLPAIVQWIIGIVLIVYGILVLVGRR